MTYQFQSPYREFHLLKKYRQLFKLSDALYSIKGTVITVKPHAARILAEAINSHRDAVHNPAKAARAGHLNAIGLTEEIFHNIIDLYRKECAHDIWSGLYGQLTDKLGSETVTNLLANFADNFPTSSAYKNNISGREYLLGTTDNIPNHEIALEEMMMVWLANRNQAYTNYLELFSEEPLKSVKGYDLAFEILRNYFMNLPKFGPENQDLVEFLLAPSRACPGSIEGQLEFIRDRWGNILGDLLTTLLTGLDLIKEENKMRGGVGGGDGPDRDYLMRMAYEAGLHNKAFLDLSRMSAEERARYLALHPELAEEEIERFSPDTDWMPRVILLAKNAFVWLYQLSKQYGRDISTLDQIPDEELDALVHQGITGLWLIGLWERSTASKRIKQICGNPEAEASAYSLKDYEIAASLGGYHAYENLRDRTAMRGIRLASDMVPNHTGIDSNWVYDHPDWFVQLDEKPYPNYSFTGENFSQKPGVSIRIEDHYYDRTDAAVVFEHRDENTGRVRYIYHGNDGTTMPWNDTAQLNYILPEVRAAVMDNILKVARMFHIIRFDAAMTLAKRHYQRLWYPEPGKGGDICTRAEHAMSKEEFNRVFPVEFWREVVDRVAAEVPDTLLLAEAFWLMESYFVRTLGMHRVYNSAFMHMLKKEENGAFRAMVKNTLEFDPQILKRYVNFMSNPDEDTAEAQFGKGDKYFGVCTVMVTMPGLPMIGHGQFQGFTEKYGMEYRRAYRDEFVDQDLMARHDRQIFPLMKKRYLFAEVENFLMYDFYTPEGTVNEHVLAYSNRFGGEKALVVYHNRYGQTRGWIRTSVGYSVKHSDDSRSIEQKSLGDGLAISGNENNFTVMKEFVSGLEYIIPSNELATKGLELELSGYTCKVFLNIREVNDVNGDYRRLYNRLGGNGVPSIDEAVTDLALEPIHNAFRELLNPGWTDYLWRNRGQSSADIENDILSQLHNKLTIIANAAADFTGRQVNYAFVDEVKAATLKLVTKELASVGDPLTFSFVNYLQTVQRLGVLLAEDGLGQNESSLELFNRWHLARLFTAAIKSQGASDSQANNLIALSRILIRHQDCFASKANAQELLQNLCNDQAVLDRLQVHEFDNILWFNREAADELFNWLEVQAIVNMDKPKVAVDIIAAFRKAAVASGYQLHNLFDLLQNQPAKKGVRRKSADKEETTGKVKTAAKTKKTTTKKETTAKTSRATTKTSGKTTTKTTTRKRTVKKENVQE